MLKNNFLAKCQRNINRILKITAKCFFTATLILAVFLFVPQVKAATIDLGISYATATGLGTQDIRVTVANIIRVFLGLLGTIAISLIIYGGYTWMTAVGNPEKIVKAKKILIDAAIGLAIILSAFAIVSFIIGAITGGGFGLSSGNKVFGGGGGALGGGIIESHYPGRNATGIPRNTSIVITFKEKMNVASLITNNAINTKSVKIYKKGDSANLVSASASVASDQRSFVFKPNDLLGSPDNNTDYIVELTNNIATAAGANSLGVAGYNWTFEVSTFVDNTPPQIVSVIPQTGAKYPRNVAVQINFSEAINPTTIGGKAVLKNGSTTGSELTDDSYKIINLKTKDGNFIAGQFYYSNQYQTVEFVSNDLCGQNSCGGNVYCLPASDTLTVLAQAASLAAAGEPAAVFPYDGIVDMATNSLDGNANGQAEGQTTDNYSWNFNTTDEIDLIPPEIVSYSPSANDTEVSPLDNFTVTFSKLMMSSTLKQGSGYGDGYDYITLSPGTSGYWISSKNDMSASQTKAVIDHVSLIENSDYSLNVGSGVKDIYQNCYQPCSGPGCARQATGTVGQYQKGSQWQGNYPSCSITQ